MSLLYKSLRVGRYGKPFWIFKIRTLTEAGTGYAEKENYTRYGKLLRTLKIDELPQLLNVLRGQMALVGPRPEEQSTIDAIPEDVRETILSVKPGLTSPASIYFSDEEKLLQEAHDPSRLYWTAIKPMKMFLDVWYVKNKSVLLDLAILWGTLRKLITKK